MRTLFIQNNKGMTLVEIMMVLVIVGGLMAVLAVNVKNQSDKAKIRQTEIQLSKIRDALNIYYSDCGHFPAEQTGLSELMNNSGSCKRWGPSPYLQNNELQDTWGRDIAYSISSQAVNIISLGLDGIESNDDIQLQVDL